MGLLPKIKKKIRKKTETKKKNTYLFRLKLTETLYGRGSPKVPKAPRDPPPFWGKWCGVFSSPKKFFS